MIKQKQISWVLAALLAAAVFMYWTGFGGAQNILYRDALYLATSFAAVVGGLYAISLYGFKGSRARTLLLLTGGMFCWFVGEVLFTYYADVIHQNPFPSVADYFYVSAYPLLLLGLLNEIGQAGLDLSRLKKGYLFLFSLVSLLFAGIVAYFGMYLAYDVHEALFTNLIAMGYGGGDLLLIIASMLLLILAWEFKGGKLARAWFFVFLSFLCTLVADILFALYTAPYKQQVYLYKNLFDTLWMIGYIFFAYAMFDVGVITEEVKNTIRRKKRKNK